MRSKAIFMALLAFAFGAQAVPVSLSQAVSAANRWARSGTVLGERFGAEVDVSGARAVSIGADVAFYAVPFKGAGTVFVSATTDREPVVAFVSSAKPDLSEKSPLYQLLVLDARFRAGVAARRSAAVQASVAPAVSSSGRIDRKWCLLSAAAPSAAAPIDEGAAGELISDIRVAPLLETRWGQTSATDPTGFLGALCYNYYTPTNYPCGCTATATSQLLRYFKYPEAYCGEQLVYTNLVDGKKAEMSILCDEESAPIPYAWEKMDAKPVYETDVERREAIGHLTYDVAVTLESSFSKNETGVTQDGMMLIAKKLRDSFGYKDAYVFSDKGQFQEGGLHKEPTREKILYANLDAAKPVVLGIFGYAKDESGVVNKDATGGHAVVADGYGFTEIDGVRTAYVHINLGWNGTDDAWYNIPDIDTASAGATVSDASGYDFMFMNSALYNVTTNEDEIGKSILSGRVTDKDGAPVEGAIVTIRNAKDGTEAARLVSGSNGIYSVVLDCGAIATYSVRADMEDGRLAELETPVELKANVTDPITNWVKSVKSVGNSWGNDLMVLAPTVRIVRGATTNLFSTLDRALATLTDGDTVEILAPTELRKTCAVSQACTIVSTNEDPYATPIDCFNEAMLTVDSKDTFFSNVVFRSSSATVKSTGGTINLSGIAVFDDIVSGTAGLILDKANHLKIWGSLLNGITLDCEGASSSGDMVGYFYGDEADAQAAGVRIVASSGSKLAAGKVAELYPGLYELLWAGDVVVDPAVAVAYVKNSPDVYYRTLDALFAENRSGAEVVVTRSGIRLDGEYALAGSYSISAAEGQVKINAGPAAGFMVADGALTVSGLSFEGYRGNGLFVVDGAKMTITNSFFRNIEGTNFHSGVVAALNGGSLIVRDSTFVDCRATGVYSPMGTVASSGGAIYVGAGGRLDIRSTAVVDCFAASFGGGIYVDSTTNSPSRVALGGELVVCDNRSGNRTNADLRNENDFQIRAEGVSVVCAEDLTGGENTVGIEYQFLVENDCAFGNAEGDTFATFDAGISAAATKKAFFNTARTDLHPAVDESAFVWSAIPDNRVPESLASCEVVGGGESANGFYGSVEDALAALTGNAVIILRKSVDLNAGVEITNKVVICTTNEMPFTVRRHNNAMIEVTEGGSLTLTNVVVEGRSSAAGLIAVEGGELTLQSGAKICNVTGSETRASCAITVWHGGTFTMESGSEISGCYNLYEDWGSLASYGGALQVGGESAAYLLGGTITDCGSMSAAVFVGNESVCYISGDMKIFNNFALDGFDDNLSVSDNSRLILTDDFRGEIWCHAGYQADPGVIGTAVGFTGDVQVAAHLFRNDWTGDYGMAVTNGTDTLLVWGSALKDDGTYSVVDEEQGREVVYRLAGNNPVVVQQPDAAEELVYDGTEKVGVPEGVGYVIVDNVGTNAGDYTATATIRPGFAWASVGEAAREIPWSIAPADYVLEGIEFMDCIYPYVENEMQFHPGISGTLPDWLHVKEYKNNGRTEPGTNEVVAVIEGTCENYKLSPSNPTNLVAKLIILPPPDEPRPPTPPGPTPPEMVDPDPIAFTSIEKVDGNWVLVATNAKQWCWYSLWSGTDLNTNGYEAVMVNGALSNQWLKADGPITNSVPVDESESVRFWIIRGAPGEKQEN